jgi:hypothetical protein
MAGTNRILDAKLVRATPHGSAGLRPLDAIDFLKAEHQRVERLFRRFPLARTPAERESLGEKICELLAVHMRIEEEIFYPAFLQATGDVEMHHEAEVEHDGAKILIAQIRESSADDAHYAAKIKVLATMIRHHVQEEEKRDGMFAEARSAGMDLLALGEQLKARRVQLKRRLLPRRALAVPART